jgi:hypothetical protein
VSIRSKLSSAIALVVLACPVYAQPPEKPKGSSDLDAFMERALARREVNRKVLNDYILDEKEEFEILGPGRYRLHRTSREYTWFVREGTHVRSPLRFDGVTVPEEARVKYEENWLRRERERQERKAKGQKESKEVAITPSGVSANVVENVPTEPRFVSEAYFMDFKFEPGNYYLAGREKFEGQDVLKIEYYPTKLFGDDEDEKKPKEPEKESKKETPQQQRERQREKEFEQDIDRKMNKTALVTLWVDPKIHQIVKYTFDNVWMDFLPGAWLVRVDKIRASMTMYQPFDGVWLPRGIDISAGITLANGSFEAAYERAFSDYREADVKSRIRIPKGELAADPDGDDPDGDRPLRGPVPDFAADEIYEFRRGPWDPASDTNTGVAAQAAQTGPVPVLREVRVHGNAMVPDEAVLKIAEITVGAPLPQDAVATIEKRLKDSGRFETVQVRLRYRSIDDPSDVALLLVVHEKAGVVAKPSGEIDRSMSKRITSRIMFLPILSYADGYGFTYGARFSTVDLLGAGERLSVPLTWGGMRRAALEAERTFDRGPFTRILGSVGIWQRENPRHEIDDQRQELKGRVERTFAQVLYLGADTSRQAVEFGTLDDRVWTVGADAAIDTRGNPNYPANAVYLGGKWNALNLNPTSSSIDSGLLTERRINRYTLDGRGYLRLIRQAVLAGRARYTTSDAPLPVYERWLIGGSDTLRGFDTGEFEGDKALVTSAELRVPITSVISGGKLGVNMFMDAAKTTDYGLKLKDADWQRGVGAGVFLIASIFRLNLDVAHSLDGAGTHVHLSTGFVF